MSPTVATMLRRASASTGLPVSELLGAHRYAPLCRARFAVIMAARNRGICRLARSYPIIAKQLGNRHHTSIINGHERAREMMKDRSFRKLVGKVARP